MANNKNIPNIISLIEVTFVLLAIGMGYTISEIVNTYSADKQAIQTEEILKELKELRSIYNTSLAEKTTKPEELKAQKEKIDVLEKELEENKNVVALQKNEILSKKTSLTSKYTEENKSDIVANKTIVSKPKVEENDVNVVERKRSSATLASLSTQNTNAKVNTNTISNTSSLKPETIVEKKKYSKVLVTHLLPMVYKVTNSNAAVATDQAKHADFVRVSFDLEANPTAKAETKKYYIQIINSKNNVIGKKVTEYFNEGSLTYSFAKEVNYSNEAVQIVEDIECDKFEKGLYNVFLFDKGEMVGSTTFTLK